MSSLDISHHPMVTFTQNLSFFSIPDTLHSSANEQPEQEASTLLALQELGPALLPFLSLNPHPLCHVIT